MTAKQLVFKNGMIYSLGSRAEAMAISGERIQAIGSNLEIEELVGLDSQVIDLGGRRYLDLDRHETVGTITLAPFKSQVLIDNGEVGLDLFRLEPDRWLVDEAEDFVLKLTGRQKLFLDLSD